MNIPTRPNHMACALLMWGAGLACARAEFRYFGAGDTFAPFADSTVLRLKAGSTDMLTLDREVDELDLCACLSSPLSRAAQGGIGFALLTGQTDTITLTLTPRPGADDIYGTPRLNLAVNATNHGGNRTYALQASPSDYAEGNSNAVLTLQVMDASDGNMKLRLLGGRTRSALLWESLLPGDNNHVSAVGFIAAPGTNATVSRAALWLPDEPARDTPETVHATAVPSTPYAGQWMLLDYAVDDTFMRPGGDYILSFLADNDGGYTILYEEGATVCPGHWVPGMRKGSLRPTKLPGLYRLDWLDAEGDHTDRGATLQFTGTDLCVITFPSSGSTLRLHRLR